VHYSDSESSRSSKYTNFGTVNTEKWSVIFSTRAVNHILFGTCWKLDGSPIRCGWSPHGEKNSPAVVWCPSLAKLHILGNLMYVRIPMSALRFFFLLDSLHFVFLFFSFACTSFFYSFQMQIFSFFFISKMWLRSFFFSARQL